MSIPYILTAAGILFFSVVLHEMAHGWAAYRLGDPTARDAGRLTLNPLAHVDPVGTLIVPAILMLTQSPVVFGWAKPVPVNYVRLRHPKRDMVYVGLAGPLTNIFLAAILSFFVHANILPGAQSFLKIGILINLGLAVFNLIPIPPLDGSNLVLGILPGPWARAYARLGQQGIGIVIVFLLLYFGAMDYVIWPAVSFFLRLFGFH